MKDVLKIALGAYAAACVFLFFAGYAGSLAADAINHVMTQIFR